MYNHFLTVLSTIIFFIILSFIFTAVMTFIRLMEKCKHSWKSECVCFYVSVFMEGLRQQFAAQKIPPDTIKLILSSRRQKTNSNYNQDQLGESGNSGVIKELSIPFSISSRHLEFPDQTVPRLETIQVPELLQISHFLDSSPNWRLSYWETPTHYTPVNRCLQWETSADKVCKLLGGFHSPHPFESTRAKKSSRWVFWQRSLPCFWL